MGIAFGVALVLAAIVLVIEGTDAKALVDALRLTARWSFVLFWLAYAGGSLAALFARALAPLAWRGRDFGLAFAAAHLVHLGLVVWIFRISSTPPISVEAFYFFSIAMVWTYLLALFSFGSLAQTLGTWAWRAFRLLGMNYILYAFAVDFVPAALGRGAHSYGLSRLVEYAPFGALCVAAPLLVLVAAAQRQLRIRYRRAGLGLVVN